MMLPFIIHVPLLVFIFILLHKRFSRQPLHIFFIPGLTIKIVAGIAIGILYQYYYTYHGDTYLYQSSSSVLTQLFFDKNSEYWNALFKNEFSEDIKQQIWVWNEPRALFFVKLLSLLNVFTFSNYWINSIYLSLFSFIGIFILANNLYKTVNAPKESLIFAFMVLPSFVLWSSGVLKESVVIGCICIIISYTLLILHNQKIHWSIPIVILLALYLGWKIKYYYITVLLAVLVPMILSTLLSKKLNSKKVSIQIGLFFSVIILITIASIIFPIINLNTILDQMYISYFAILRESQGHNVFTFENFNPTVISYLKHSPNALLNGLFRPFIWETHNIFGIAHALENLLLLLLLLNLIYRWIKKEQSVKFTLPLVTAIVYIFILAILMAFIAPNWGTLSRYKVGYIMFVFLLASWNNPWINRLVRLVSGNKENHEA